MISSQTRLFKAIILRGTAQAIGIVSPIIILAEKGPDSFGLFSILISFACLSVVLEWGQPQKLQNEVSRGDPIRHYDLKWFLFGSGLIRHLSLNIATALAIWYSISFALLQHFTPHLAEIILQNKTSLLAILLITATTSAIFSGQSIVFGLGHINKAYTFTFLASAVILTGVIAGIKANMPVSALAALVTATPLLDRIFACTYFFWLNNRLGRHQSLPAPIKSNSHRTDRRFVAPMFLYLQILALASSNIDLIYAATSAPINDIGEYAFLLKIFGIPLLVTNILSSSLVPRLAIETSVADSRGRRTVIQLIKINASVVAIATIPIFFAGNAIYELITGLDTDLKLLILILSIDVCLLAVRVAFISFVNAAEVLLPNIIGNTIYAVGAVLLKIKLVALWGVVGIIAANIMSYLIFLLPFHVYAFLKLTSMTNASRA